MSKTYVNYAKADAKFCGVIKKLNIVLQGGQNSTSDINRVMYVNSLSLPLNGFLLIFLIIN